MKKKLALDLDQLRVDTFETAGEDGGRGTIRAQGYVCTEASCTNDPTCGIPIGDSTGEPLKYALRTPLCQNTYDYCCA